MKNTYELYTDIMTNEFGQKSSETWFFSVEEPIEEALQFIYNDLARNCPSWDYVNVYDEDDDYIAVIMRDGDIETYEKED